MKRILRNLALLYIPMLIFVGCMDEAIPTEYATADQIGGSESGLNALSNSTAAFMYAYNYIGSVSSQEFGYPAMMIIRDILTDCPYVATSYNHFNTYWGTLADFTSARMRQPWRYYYTMSMNANKTLIAIGDPEEATEAIQAFYGNALIYRALSYMDLARMYEYKRTNVPDLDDEAEKNGVFGLTTVIVDEFFNPSDARNNPRVPFYHMYRFIMNDLNKAEKYLATYERPAKAKIRADLSVAHAYKARLWLEIATRFQKYPADLQTQLSHEDDEELAHLDKLGVSSAADCYKKAAEYARLVINKYTPLTEGQWHDVNNGFNNSDSESWVFAITIGSADAVHNRVDNFHSNCVTEYSRGYSRSQYHCYRMIDKRLYDQIDDDDWRKVTWIDPDDAGKKPTPDKYHTLLDDDEWALRDAYVGFKFRPNNGDISDNYTNALQVSYPIIRVEEMYFIEAEAKTYSEGLASGMNALASFLNTHRYKGGTFNVTPDGIEDFVDTYLITQKRIELWGEGLAYFDIKRRELALTHGYVDTNYLPANRYNSKSGYAPAWLNLYVPREGEATLNSAIELNPDPRVQDNYGLWTGN
ncbi:RagB/SusD family nutrient uptake outer membrane protein [Bacteroides sp. 51]|uniref:RagB/SusD family nutrient uptake outer membrane protein n=1 Tax=Bacteroides sp. 51 TaxID=2302938 RepID=UPI0013D0C1CB|nr:RagB/SusD family nutrient uptake outer membrane protein [Bacteroides sp. 51]NDV83478.1 RagB/SusD family nutrient uptake outer membrane protein [Bacteroides sp. 51]